MPLQVPASLRLPERLYSRPEMSVEERSRRGYLALCIAIMIPTLVGFAIDDVNHDRLGEASRGLVVAAGLLITLTALIRRHRIWPLFRVALSLTLALVFHQLAIGSSDGVAFLWLYSIPLIVFFVFGKKEGGFWVLATCVLLCALFFGDLGWQRYDPPLIARFLTTYVIVAMLAYLLETYRYRDYSELLREKLALEDALSQVKVLRGLLPICAACKRVRDDRGYWNQIETYLRRHSEAELVRGVCPECRGEPGTKPPADTPRGSDGSL